MRHPLLSHARHRDDNDVGDRRSRDRPEAPAASSKGLTRDSSASNRIRHNRTVNGPPLLWSAGAAVL
jgi:hypothetical protein